MARSWANANGGRGSGSTPSAAATVAGSSQKNTGLFDLNSGLVIANQGLGSQPEPGTFINQYPNWTNEINLRGI